MKDTREIDKYLFSANEKGLPFGEVLLYIKMAFNITVEEKFLKELGIKYNFYEDGIYDVEKTRETLKLVLYPKKPPKGYITLNAILNKYGRYNEEETLNLIKMSNVKTIVIPVGLKEILYIHEKEYRNRYTYRTGNGKFRKRANGDWYTPTIRRGRKRKTNKKAKPREKRAIKANTHGFDLTRPSSGG